MFIQLSNELKNIVSLGVIIMNGIKVVNKNPLLWGKIEELCNSISLKYKDKNWTEISGLVDVREMYKKIGIDPTHTRPSSEALFRRVMQGKGLYQVNSLVDMCNYCSLDFLLPLGLYDTDKIEGNVICRLGREGECFDGIRKDKVNVSRRMVLSDDIGAFGNPTSDSARTMITEQTTNAMMVIFAPSIYFPEILKKDVDKAKELISCYIGGNITHFIVN